MSRMVTRAWQVLSLILVLLTMGALHAPARTLGWRPVSASGSPTAAWYHALAYDAGRGVLVRFGGYENFVATDETWEMDLRTRIWVRRTPAHAPTPRYGTAMVYDPALGVVVLFGGVYRDNIYENDTWTWDGQDWTDVSPLNSPTGRMSHGLVYDTVRSQVVLFGGYNLFSGGDFNDLWQWDGRAWTERPATTRPGARDSMALAYDSQRDAVVLFGGVSGSGSYHDTWEYVAGDWVQRQPARHPSARWSMTAGYLPELGRTLIFGGQDASFSRLSETWAWDGTNWSGLPVQDHPDARSHSPATYVPRLHGLMLYGGIGNNAAVFDDTWVFLARR